MRAPGGVFQQPDKVEINVLFKYITYIYGKKRYKISLKAFLNSRLGTSLGGGLVGLGAQEGNSLESQTCVKKIRKSAFLAPADPMKPRKRCVKTAEFMPLAREISSSKT